MPKHFKNEKNTFCFEEFYFPLFVTTGFDTFASFTNKLKTN